MPHDMSPVIATRKSPLARKQTELVCECLRAHHSETVINVLPLSTKVDERLNWSLEKRGGLGLFTKELEAALLDGRADLAVHSAKDMPTAQPDGLSIAGYLPRATSEDVLIYREGSLPAPKTIATSSPRRRAQLQLRFPDTEWTTLRGNVATRLQKIQEGQADATVLAAAGLERLEITSWEGLCFEPLSIDAMVPAPGQAAIAVECRSEDLAQFKGIFCEHTGRAVELERAFLRGLGSGCQTPVGAYFEKDSFHVYHPTTGYRIFPLDLPNLGETQTVANGIISDLNLNEQHEQ
ncbi:MAG: hydroxymethylbilane synthase [Verrucomicrobia bacterium]|nr:hydroxymethylbilane synthase [Verrucomicrobiota bacterium]